jgi:transposase-like protein
MTFNENNVTQLKMLCDYCNAKLEVNIAKQVGLNVKENFRCPECKKIFSARAFLPINKKDVKLITPRSDGRNDKYGEV